MWSRTKVFLIVLYNKRMPLSIFLFLWGHGKLPATVCCVQGQRENVCLKGVGLNLVAGQQGNQIIP